MADDPRPEVSAKTAPPVQQAGIGKRRLLIKAALIGSAMPVVMTISRSAFAYTHQCAQSSTHQWTVTGPTSNGRTSSRCYASYG